MNDRNRPSCGVTIAFGLCYGVLGTLSILAVDRWGVLALALIVLGMLVVSFALLAMYRSHPAVEGAWRAFPFLIMLLISGMWRELGLPFWGWVLMSVPVTVAIWFFGSRLLLRWGGSRR